MATEALKPQDVFVACQIALLGEEPFTHANLADRLHLSTSTVFDALGRLRQAKLTVGTAYQPARLIRPKLCEFLVHAVPTIYFPKKIEVVRGIPTSVFSPLFRDRFTSDLNVALVWPYSKGKEQGEGLLPIYPTVPIACSQDQDLYQLMAAIDVLRVGKVREREAAVSYLEDLLEANRGDEQKESA
jgi:hypothetical protein